MNVDQPSHLPGVDRFNRDVAELGGYAYTGDRLSSRLANQRITDAIVEAADVAGKRVIDVGCGDGTYTIELAAAGAESVLGTDAAAAAVERARSRTVGREDLRF